MNLRPETWHYGLAVLLAVAGSGWVLVAAIRTPATGLPRPARCWPLLLVLLMWTGDAAVGDGRPAFERAGKGTVAVLLWSSLAVTVVRRRRAATPPAGQPATEAATPAGRDAAGPG